jgi:hypothetical protein
MFTVGSSLDDAVHSDHVARRSWFKLPCWAAEIERRGTVRSGYLPSSVWKMGGYQFRVLPEPSSSILPAMAGRMGDRLSSNR